MLKSLITLIAGCLCGALFLLLPAENARTAPGPGAAPVTQSLIQPVKAYRDCQRIARCKHCRPVYRCRSCTYQRQCRRRRGCEWVDVCVWGPYLPVAPRGVRIIPAR